MGYNVVSRGSDERQRVEQYGGLQAACLARLHRGSAAG
jgi:hypothetical protein